MNDAVDWREEDDRTSVLVRGRADGVVVNIPSICSGVTEATAKLGMPRLLLKT